MNCERYKALIPGSSAEVFEQICFVVLDICQKNQTLASDLGRYEGLEKLFGLTQPVFASIEHTCSGGLDQPAHAATLFLVSRNMRCYSSHINLFSQHFFPESCVYSWCCTLDEKFGQWNNI
jgi:hypothetical protein